jgi:hypothetical protein
MGAWHRGQRAPVRGSASVTAEDVGHRNADEQGTSGHTFTFGGFERYELGRACGAPNRAAVHRALLSRC